MFTSLKNKLMNYRPTLRSWAIGVLSGLLISPLSYNVYSLFVATPGNVVARNSDTINKIAEACDLLHRNSDLMGRYAHYTKPHIGTESFCMECSGSKVYEDDIPLDEPIDDAQTKLSQVHDDSVEINKAISSIISSLLIQNDTLDNNLRRLRTQSNR